MKSRVLFVILALAATACTSTTETGQYPTVAGGWRYAGQQVSGRGGASLVVYSGRLEFLRQDGIAFDGNFSAEARDQQGVVQLMTGIFTGYFVDPAAVDFDVTIGQETRRHVARLRNDSLVGNWVSSDGVSAGSFTAVREVK